MLAEQEVKGLEYVFVFCMIWCMGAGLEIMEGNKSRINFDKFWRDTWKTIKFPSKGTVFDYYFDNENSKMEDWNKLRNDFNIMTPLSLLLIHPRLSLTTPSPQPILLLLNTL